MHLSTQVSHELAVSRLLLGYVWHIITIKLAYFHTIISLPCRLEANIPRYLHTVVMSSLLSSGCRSRIAENNSSFTTVGEISCCYQALVRSRFVISSQIVLVQLDAIHRHMEIYEKRVSDRPNGS